MEMSKITITENDLRKIVEMTIKDYLSEGVDIEGIIGNTFKFGRGVISGNKRDIDEPVRHGLSKAVAGVHNIFADKDNKWSADEIERMSRNGNVGGKSDKADKFGVSIKNNSRFVRYDDTTKNMAAIDDRFKNTLVGHIASPTDKKSDGQLATRLSELSRRYIDDVKIENKLQNWLENRDRYFETGKMVNENINEVPVFPAVKTAAKLWGAKKAMKKIANNPLVKKQMDMRVIEKNVLPSVLNSLCNVLSIEKEDPMYQLITSKETTARIMKELEKGF